MTAGAWELFFSARPARFRDIGCRNEKFPKFLEDHEDRANAVQEWTGSIS